jgi:sigma-E factor negative regulatory protein RseA
MQEKDQKNQDVILESVSALMDGEASELDLRRVLKAAGQDPAVADSWQRYHLVRASLQQEVHRRPAVNLLAGINARLAEDDQPLAAPLGHKYLGALRRLGQGAIAASFAVTALYMASYLQSSDSEQVDGLTTAAATAGQDQQMPSLGGDFTPSELSRTVSMDAAARKRLQQAVYQSSTLQKPSFGEPYIFPETETTVLPLEASPQR